MWATDSPDGGGGGRLAGLTVVDVVDGVASSFCWNSDRRLSCWREV